MRTRFLGPLLASLAFAVACSGTGESDDAAENASGSGGSEAAATGGTGGSAGTGGTTSTGGNAAIGGSGGVSGSGGVVTTGGTQATGGDAGTGGSGGTPATGGDAGAGGTTDTGGTGGATATGGSAGAGGTAATGGAADTGGAGGTPATGGSAGTGGTGGETLDCDFYVATTGNDSNTGTVNAPFKTVGRAQTAASAGDLICIRGGTYAFSGSGTVGVSFTKSGTANNLIKYWAYPGEVPVFDLTNLTPSNRVTGLDVNCSYVHLRGLEVKGVHQYMSGQDSWGVRIRGSNNVLENLNVHHNDAPGIFITSGASNQVLNCDSHHNYDFLEGGGSGDGFGCHSTGSNNVFSGCRAYDNSDDGFDFINAAGSCTAEKSFAFRNGYEPGTTTAKGNGAGFKAGGYGSPPTVPASGAATHTIRQCVAFGNRSQGFYANHHPGKINFYNNTAFRNSVNYNMLADAGYPSSHDVRNNIAMTPGTAISNLSGGSATYNSWNLTVTVSAADFSSVDESLASAPRQADGSLPNNAFLRLVSGSDLVDKGQNVGLPYTGAAPDLGAFER